MRQVVQPIRVMVTGAGSMVGQGIIKSLNKTSLSVTIIAADISVYHAGLYRADEAVIIPRVEMEDAYQKMVSILITHNIDVVMIGSEFDLNFFAEYKKRFELETKALIIVSSLEAVAIANDKWRTVQFLKELNLPYPLSYLASNLDEALLIAEELKYPFILKGRHGTSAKNVYMINSSEELKSLFFSVPSPMLQQMINRPNNELGSEYTCSLFKTKDKEIIGPFNSRRVLKNGSSWVTEVKAFEFLNPLLLKIANNLDFMGSINIQLMNCKDGPVPFEFNARSSGTTAIRSHFGFNEPEMSLLSYFLNKKITSPIIESGYCFRYVEELFLPPDFLENSNFLNIKAEKNSWF